jgi:uncharacterized SAM-binding protein YcdF (DUF218 family)
MSYLEPALPLLLLLGVVGLGRAWLQSSKGRRPVLLTVSTLGLLLLTSRWAAWGFALPLEAWYDNTSPYPSEPAEAIVVLAGSSDRSRANRPYVLAGQDSHRRLKHAAWLFKHWKSVPILISGGNMDTGEPHALEMRRLLEAEGVPANLIWIEARSQSTRENAVYGAEILHRHNVSRIALVVEASSMPRASLSFQKAGLYVVAAPIRFLRPNWEASELLPSWQSIALNGETLHEFLGLLWYRWRGWV